MPQHPRRFVRLSGRVISLGTQPVLQTGLKSGLLYRFTAAEAPLVVRWGEAAVAVGDGGFDFALGQGDSVVIEAQSEQFTARLVAQPTGPSASLLISQYDITS